MQEINPVEEVWDKKRILVTVVSTVIILSGGVYGAYALGFIAFKKPEGTVNTIGKVEGVSVSENIDDTPTPTPSRKSYSLPARSDIEEKLEEVKKEINTLNVAEIASSSPQVKKILQDLKFLQDYPGNQAREMCLKICSSL